MKTLKIKIFVLLIICIGYFANAQDPDEIEIQLKNKRNIPTYIIFKESGKAFKKGKEKDVFKKYLKLNGKDELRKIDSSKDKLGYTHEKYEHFYDGIRVEGSVYNVHIKNDTIKTINGNFETIGNIKVKPEITEELALKMALDYVGANEYMWEISQMEEWIKKESNNSQATYYPKGELVIVKNRFGNEEMCLAYKFDVYANKPFSRDYLYVDACTGTIVNKEPIIKYSASLGVADTRYSDEQSIVTDYYNGIYRLRDYTRGNGIEVLNMNTQLNLSNLTEFEDNDNNWTSGEWNNAAKDNAALDALWAVQKTYDYFSDNFERESYDEEGGLIKCYVHWGQNYENSAWDDCIKVGDGGFSLDALSSIDVIAHEFAHGIYKNEIGNSGINEPGALNEGLSDIWASCVEYNAAPDKERWLSGEDIAYNGYCNRSLSDPNTTQKPAKVGDIYWIEQEGCSADITNDYCGIHTNCTVIGHWFYLLTEGGKGVSGIGMDDAATLVYRAETQRYFDQNTYFLKARLATLNCARDEFGFNSNQLIQTGKAWYAVGVGGFDFMPVLTDTEIRGGSNYVPYNGINTFYITPASDTLTYTYRWSIIPYSMGCSSTLLPYFVGSNTGTSVVVKHGSCSGTYILRCEARNYWCSSYYQDRVITVYNPSGGGGGDPIDPCDPVMTVYPNPAKKSEVTILKIQYPPPGDDPCEEYPEAYSAENNEIKIFDLSGNLLMQESFNADTYSIKNSHFRNGIYVITIIDKKGKLHQKRLQIK